MNLPFANTYAAGEGGLASEVSHTLVAMDPNALSRGDPKHRKYSNLGAVSTPQASTSLKRNAAVMRYGPPDLNQADIALVSTGGVTKCFDRPHNSSSKCALLYDEGQGEGEAEMLWSSGRSTGMGPIGVDSSSRS